MPFIEAPTSFYLGRRYDPENHRLTDDIVYYDSRDLTTHAVVVGMTGSGKTGLCINLLEDLPHGQCYTRRHGDQPQALDHILVSPALRRGATVRIAHINSDVAPGHPEPASDHDPVVATLPM